MEENSSCWQIGRSPTSVDRSAPVSIKSVPKSFLKVSYRVYMDYAYIPIIAMSMVENDKMLALCNVYTVEPLIAGISTQRPPPINGQHTMDPIVFPIKLY